ncbi:MAG: MarR family transcriptional regulator [Clostridia bacterium]|nr:MarR family transcriptional regulator [Clostridia bacterium]
MDTPIAGYGWYIKRIDNALEKEANANLQKLNLTMQQNRVLIHLAHAEGHTLSLKALEEHFGAAQSTIAGLASRLEKKGLVEALSDPCDKRIKLVKLSEEGARLHAISRSNVVASEERLTALLTAEEKEVLLSCLRKVYEAVK